MPARCRFARGHARGVWANAIAALVGTIRKHAGCVLRGNRPERSAREARHNGVLGNSLSGLEMRKVTARSWFRRSISGIEDF